MPVVKLLHMWAPPDEHLVLPSESNILRSKFDQHGIAMMRECALQKGPPSPPSFLTDLVPDRLDTASLSTGTLCCIETMNRSTTTLSSDSSLPRSQDGWPAAAATSTGSECFNAGSKRRSSRAGLTSTLYGSRLTALCAATDYKAPNNLPPGEKPDTIDIKLDIKRVGSLIQTMSILSEQQLLHAVNRSLTLENLKDLLRQLRESDDPKFVYIGGHGEGSASGEGFHYLPDDHAERDKNGQLRRLSSKELKELLIDSTSDHQTRMILMTDFCFSNNFLGLPWVLRQGEGDTFYWDESEEYVPGANDHDHKILQFAAGAKDQKTYTFKDGSIFNRAFYNAEHTGVDDAVSPVSLSARQADISSFVAKFLDSHHLINGRGQERLVQVPQVYASEKFDLNDPKTLRRILQDF